MTDKKNLALAFLGLVAITALFGLILKTSQSNADIDSVEDNEITGDFNRWGKNIFSSIKKIPKKQLALPPKEISNKKEIEKCKKNYRTMMMSCAYVPNPMCVRNANIMLQMCLAKSKQK